MLHTKKRLRWVLFLMLILVANTIRGQGPIMGVGPYDYYSEREIGSNGEDMKSFVWHELPPTIEYIQFEIVCSGYGTGEAQIDISFDLNPMGTFEKQIYASEHYNNGHFINSYQSDLLQIYSGSFNCSGMVQSLTVGDAASARIILYGWYAGSINRGY